MRTKGDIIKAALVCGVAFGALANAGIGRAAEADEASDPNMIVVTANKRSEKLADVAQSVSAIGGEELSYRNLVRIEDFAAQVPGFNIESGGPRTVRLILRGVNTGGAGATVGVMIDETPFSYQSGLTNGAIDTANLDTFDMARIEVLKGPQGTLYGATAEGGLLKYVTNKPNLEKVEAAIEGTGEIVDQGTTGGGIKAMINLPFWGGKGAIRASGFYTDVAGFVDNPLAGRNNSNNGRRYGGRVSILLKPTDTLDVRLTGSRQDQKFFDDSSVEVVGANADPLHPPANAYDIANGGRLVHNSFNGNPSKNYYEYANLTLDWDVGFASILSSTSYSRLSSQFRSDATSTNLAPGVTYGQYLASAAYGEPISFFGRQTNAGKRWNQEFRISSKPDLKIGGMGLDWQLGGFFAKEDITFSQFYDAISLATGQVLTAPGPAGGSNLPGKYKEFSGFGSATLHITDSFDLTGGGRYADTRQESQVINYPGLLTGVSAVFYNPVIKSHENKFTWSAAAKYKFDGESSLYARVATGYRSGGPNLVVPGAPADFPFSYKPDNLTNYEVGLRTSLFDNKLAIDVAAFYIDWKDIQVLAVFQSSTGVPYTVVGNAGAAKSQGGEWSFTYTPLKGLRISDAGAYTDAHLTADAPGLRAFSGNRLPNVPKWSNALNVDVETPLADNVKGFAGVSWVYTGKRVGGFNSNPAFANQIPLPSYSTINGQAGVEFGRYSASLYVRNLANERGFNTFDYNNGYNLTGNAQIIQPRTVGIKLSAKY